MKPTTKQALEALGIDAYAGPIDESPEKGKGVRIDCRIGGARKFLEAWMNSQAVPFRYTHNDNERTSEGNMRGGHLRQLKSFHDRDKRVSPDGTDPVEYLHRGLQGQQDMKPFHEALKRFENSGIMARLKPVINKCEMRRKRQFSEYDGEWNYDRRNELAPFQRTFKQRAEGRSVTVLADFVTSGGAGGAAVNAYGATVWGICQILERCQLKVRVVAQNLSGDTVHGIGDTADDKLKYSPTDLRIVIKEAGEYMAPNLLAGCFVEGFYRILCWGIRTTAIDSLDCVGNGGMGSGWGKPAIKFEKGILHLSAHVTKAYDAEVEREILKAIKGDG